MRRETTAKDNKTKDDNTHDAGATAARLEFIAVNRNETVANIPPDRRLRRASTGEAAGASAGRTVSWPKKWAPRNQWGEKSEGQQPSPRDAWSERRQQRLVREAKSWSGDVRLYGTNESSDTESDDNH